MINYRKRLFLVCLAGSLAALGSPGITHADADLDPPRIESILLKTEKPSLVVSQELKTNAGRYSAINGADDNHLTAWCTRGEEKKWIKYSFDGHRVNGGQPVKSLNIQILPGYARTDRLFFANSRPRSVEVVVVSRRTDRLIIRKTIELLDAPRNQVFNLDLGGPFDFHELIVTLSVNNVFKGSKYSDFCLSEFQVLPGNIDSLKFDGGGGRTEASEIAEQDIILEQALFLRLLQLNYKDDPVLMYKAVNWLAHSRYLRTAEGEEGISELWLDLYVKFPGEFLRAVEVQEENVREFIIRSALLVQINDKYSYDDLYRAAVTAKRLGITDKITSPLLREFSKK
jgi:hypothetical protein